MSTPTITERLEAATVKAEGASQIMHDVANGGPAVEVTTESGPVPSIQKWFADLNDRTSGAVGQVQEALDQEVLARQQLGERVDSAVLSYPDYAAASAAAATLPDGQRVEAPDSDGHLSSFYTNSGALIFVDYMPDLIRMQSYEKLRMYAGQSPVVHVTDRSYGGLFVLDANDTASADDDGIVIVTTAGRRYKRQFAGPVISTWFRLPFFSMGDATQQTKRFLLACKKYGSGIIAPGKYKITEPLEQPAGTHIVGMGSLSAWILGSAFYPMDMGVTFVFDGTLPKLTTLDNVSAMRQCGASRDNIARYYNNAFDASFDLTDFTNQDAVGATRATLRPFSVAWTMGGDGDSNKAILENIRLVPACYASGSSDPLSGYGVTDSIPAFSEVDVGLYTSCAWHNEVRDCQIVGYWNMRGLLQSSIRFGNTTSGGRGEHVHYRGCRFQSGVAVRNGDFWPILAKTTDTLTVAWTASHRFTTSGSLMTNAGTISYAGLSFASGQLTFTGCSSTAAVVVSGSDRSYIYTTNNNGTTQTMFSDCEVLDFFHASGVERPSPAFGAQASYYRPAVELAGHPVRGVRFSNNNVYNQEPVSLHIIGAENTEIYAQTTEAKAHKNTLGGASITASGLCIVGPKDSELANVPLGKRGDLTMYGFAMAGYVNRAPMRVTTSGRRFSSMTGVCNPSFYQEDAVGTDQAIRYNAELPRTVRISSGVISPTDAYFRVDTEGSTATDDLTDIVAPPWLNEVKFGTVNSSRDVTIKYDTSKISTKSAADLTLFGPHSQVTFRRYNGVWYEV